VVLTRDRIEGIQLMGEDPEQPAHHSSSSSSAASSGQVVVPYSVQQCSSMLTTAPGALAANRLLSHER